MSIREFRRQAAAIKRSLQSFDHAELVELALFLQMQIGGLLQNLPQDASAEITSTAMDHFPAGSQVMAIHCLRVAAFAKEKAGR